MSDLSAHDRPVVYAPQPGFQTEIHRRQEDIITIGGTKGPGKTHGMIGESLRQIDHPKYHGIFFRRTFPRLQEIIDRAHGLFPQLGGKWSGDLKRYKFPSGAVIDFSHMESEEDKRNHQGKEYTAQFWDQIEEFTESQFDYVSAQNRTSHAGLRCYIMASHNPGGVGHAWVNRRFVKGKTPGQTYEERVTGPDGTVYTKTLVFIRGNIYENKKLIEANPQYLATLMNLPPKLRIAFMEGNYDILEGQYFEEWSSVLHVIKPFQIPQEWAIFQSLDWGYENPLSCHWWAVPPGMQHVYCVREYYQTKKRSDVAAGEIHEISKTMFGEKYISSGRVKKIFADPSIFGARGHTGKTIAEDFQAALKEPGTDGRDRRLLIVPSNNDRVPGWNVFRKMLAVQPDGKPFCQWFSTCENAIRTIPEMVHDPDKPEDLDTDGEDHAADDHRYFFIERFGPKKFERPDPTDSIKDASSQRVWKHTQETVFKRKNQSVADVLRRIGV